MVVFAVIGLALYFTAAWLQQPASRVIHIGVAEVARLDAFWRAQAQRPPTAQELAGLIDDRVDEEVLYREALRLGLDRDDVIVRRRLAQKLEFVNEDTASGAAIAPTTVQLRAYCLLHRADYAIPQSFSLQQIYFVPQHPRAAVRSALRTLRSRAADAPPPALGDPFMLPLAYADVTAADLARDYGPAFAMSLATLPEGSWQGPVESALGTHLVRIVARHGALVPAFEQVTARVRQDFVAARRRAARAQWVAGLRAGYRIEVEGIGAQPPRATL